MSKPRKNVTLPLEVYDRLAATGTTQDTFGMVISRLLDEHEERARIISWAVDLVRKRMDELYERTATWEEEETELENLVADIPCEEIQKPAKEYLDQRREEERAWEEECRRDAEEAKAKELQKFEKQYLEEQERLEAEGKQ